MSSSGRLLYSRFFFKKMVVFVLFPIGLFFSSVAYGTSFTMPAASSTGTFNITLSNYYTWEFQEHQSGSWVTVKSGSVGSSRTFSLTRTNGGYSFRLKNCVPAYYGSGSCSATTSKTIFIAIAPAAPANVNVEQIGSHLVVEWSSVTAANKYEWRRNSGSVMSGAVIKYIDDTVNTGQAYTYSVRACYNSACSPWAYSNSVQFQAVASGDEGLTKTFTYDALGRLTFVDDSRPNMNRDYDYDAAGNRVNVAVATNSDDSSEPGAPSPPANAQYSYGGNCYHHVSWDASVSSLGGVYYIVRDNRNRATQITGTGGQVLCDYNVNPPTIYPVSVQACNVSGCSGLSHF